MASLPCRVGGRIIDGASGEPIAAGSWVKLTSKDRLHTLEGNHGGGQTDADGRFSAGPLRRGRYELRVEGMRFVRVVDVASRDTARGDIAVE